jgi:hypothetical protein
MHRKIYQEHYGEIPRDEYGKSYHIHHIDGDHGNNNPENLRAVTAQDHYDIHYAQGDYYACVRLGGNLNKTGEELSELARIANTTRIAQGNHNWCNNGESQRQVQQRLIAEGTHNFNSSNHHPSGIKLSCIECRTILTITNYRKHNSKEHNIILEPLSQGSRHSKRRTNRGQGRTKQGLLPI